jgi:hypothetical protein
MGVSQPYSGPGLIIQVGLTSQSLNIIVSLEEVQTRQVPNIQIIPPAIAQIQVGLSSGLGVYFN